MPRLDDLDFDQLVDPLRAEITAHCYRMLGSLADAEDVMQESFLRAWKGWDGFEPRAEDPKRSVRSWLYKIATNRCLTFLGRSRRRELPTDMTPGDDAHEVLWLEPLPDARMSFTEHLDPAERVVAWESVELAFLVALQGMPATQRAVLLLREVLGYSAAETASLLDTSVAAVNSALQRARAARGRRASPASSADAETGLVARRYAAAWEAGDVDAIIAMLAEDARYSMPPLPEWYAGRESIRGFLVDGPLRLRWRFLPTRANGHPAFATYMWDADAAAYVPKGLDLLVVRGNQVAEVVSFLDADFTDFGLPTRITEDFAADR